MEFLSAHFNSTSIIVLILTIIILSVCIRQRYFSPISSIPGPQTGTVGTFFQVWHVFKGQLDDTLSKLHRKHGAFVRISYNEVSVCHPDALQILAAPIWKGSFYSPMAIPNGSYNNLMSERDPKKHSVMRSSVAPAYSLSNVLKNEPIIDEVIELMEQRLVDMSQQNQQINLGQWLHFLTYDLLGEFMFSSRFGFLDQGRDVGGSIHNSFYFSLYVTSMTYMQWLHSLLVGNPLLRWIDFQPTEHTFTTAVNCIAARKAHTEARVDMMEHWKVQHEKRPEKFSDKDMHSAIIATIAAGAGTVASVLEAFFYFLLKEDTKYLRHLQEEIDRENASTIVSYSEAQQLPYLQAVIKETLRLWPPVAWNLPRVVPKEGLTVAGRHFQQGTILSVNPWLIHRNQACFGKDADEYNPERWLGDPATVKEMERYLIPYGLGYNACPGRNVAVIELSKITATLIRDFEFRLTDPKAEMKYHRLFVTSQYGWSVYLKRRR